MGRICSGGLPEVARVLHEWGYSLLILELWPWSHLSLLFVTVLNCRGARPPFDALAWLCLYLGDALARRRLCLAMPLSGDAFLRRRLNEAMPPTGDVLTWRCLKRPTCWLSFLLWGPRAVPPYVNFDFGVDFGQRPRTLHKPPQS